jgi:hypothetical protein
MEEGRRRVLRCMSGSRKARERGQGGPWRGALSVPAEGESRRGSVALTVLLSRPIRSPGAFCRGVTIRRRSRHGRFGGEHHTERDERRGLLLNVFEISGLAAATDRVAAPLGIRARRVIALHRMLSPPPHRHLPCTDCRHHTPPPPRALYRDRDVPTPPAAMHTSTAHAFPSSASTHIRHTNPPLTHHLSPNKKYSISTCSILAVFAGIA